MLVMTSDQKTYVPSLLKYIQSDLFTFNNISSSVTLVANEPDIIGEYDINKLITEGKDVNINDYDSKWDTVVSLLPLKFFDVINNIDGIYTIEKFDKKYIRNPKMCAYERYNSTNMWRPLMILNKCPRIMDFNFEWIKYYNIEKFTNILSVLISRSQSE